MLATPYNTMIRNHNLPHELFVPHSRCSRYFGIWCAIVTTFDIISDYSSHPVLSVPQLGKCISREVRALLCLKIWKNLNNCM